MFFSYYFCFEPTVSYRLTNQTINLDYTKPKEHRYLQNKFKQHYYGDHSQQYQSQITQNMSISIEDVLSLQRQQIAEEMQYYEFPNGRFEVPASKLEELTPETDGSPMRSVIITTWRSGSTFLGDILNALPGNYYHYEPLLTYDIIQIRGPPNDTAAITQIKKLLLCNYTGWDMHNYLEFGKAHNYLFTHNTRLWDKCQMFPSYCYQARFLEPYCKLFPLQSMKVVRLRMNIAARLLEDPR